MCRFHKVDLTAACNHKIVYENVVAVTDNVGLDGEYIDRRDWKVAENEEIEGVPFSFLLGEKDNILCDGQVLPVGKPASRMHVIGFAYWGDTFDNFTIRYADGRKEQCKVPFVDWAHKAPNDYRDIAWLGNNIQTVRYMITSGKGDHLACLHHSVTQLGGGRIESIVLPENFFLHVIAITFEESN